jgi:hypothetical protein
MAKRPLAHLAQDCVRSPRTGAQRRAVLFPVFDLPSFPHPPQARSADCRIRSPYNSLD